MGEYALGFVFGMAVTAIVFMVREYLIVTRDDSRG